MRIALEQSPTLRAGVRRYGLQTDIHRSSGQPNPTVDRDPTVQRMNSPSCVRLVADGRATYSESQLWKRPIAARHWGYPTMIDNLGIWLGSLKFTDLLSALSALVAVISYLLSRATVRRQEAMQIENFRNQRDNSLISWANDAIVAIADVQRHCRDIKNGLLFGPDERRAASELRTRLSVLLDTGRLFFPNQPETTDEESSAAEVAYAGQTHEAIDALYRVYRVISDLGREVGLSAPEAIQTVVAERRRFVSEVFRSIDPRRRNAAFNALTASEKSLQAFVRR